MKKARRLLFGTAAVLAVPSCAQSADLPTRKAAPIQYVKICDSFGAGFFYIPGTDTCLRVSGAVAAAWFVQNAPSRWNPAGATSVAAINNGLGGPVAVTGALGGANYSAIAPVGARDVTSSFGVGRIDLDAHTESPWGDIRAFIRVDSYFGAGGTAATGGMPGSLLGAPAYAAYAGAVSGGERTFINKAFIQFAGITMGRIQSMFDFYADALGLTGLRGSNQTVNGLAYTYTMGGGFSATLSFEDSVSHRSNAASTVLIGNAFFTGAGASSGASGVTVVGLAGTAGAASAQLNGTRLPDIVANLRLDQPWGSAQIMSAIHQIRSGLYNVGGAAAGGFATGLGVPSALSPTPTLGLFNFNNVNSIGFAVGAGVKFNLDVLAPGDVLWLQAIYAKGAIGYLSGANLVYVSGFNLSNGYAAGLGRISSGIGYNAVIDYDCVFTMMGSCDKSAGFAVDVAFRHFWTPTISSALMAGYYKVNYSANVRNPALGAAFVNVGGAAGSPFLAGMTNFAETRLAANVHWSPIKFFGIIGEVEWEHGITSRPIGLASNVVLNLLHTPTWKGQADLVRGQIRMYRAF